MTRFPPVLAAALLASSPAAADSGAAVPVPPPASDVRSAVLDLEFNLDAVSDYRFRGVSLSDRGAALQPSVTATHRSGLYASAWGSNVAANAGADLEVDLTVGWEREFGPVTADLHGTWYIFPGVKDAAYGELFTRLSTTVSPIDVGLNLAWVPAQRNLGHERNLYAGVDASVPVPGTPLTASASFGVEDGAFGHRKRDWSVGLSGEISGFTLGAAYVDTARANAGRLGKAGLVVTAGRSF